MNWSIVKNDLVRNKSINIALLFFMIFASCLAVLSVLMGVQTFQAISDLYKTAQPAHFTQMHKGDIDPEEINRFMTDNELVSYSQIDTMLDVYGENLTLVHNDSTHSLSDCRLDIGLVRQNASKDLLLSQEHERVILKEGEIGIPVLLKEMYHIRTGDVVILTDGEVTKEFTVTQFILDSMMNSSLASSTRILLSDNDYEELSGKVGEKEYLIEAYLTSYKKADLFMTAFQDAGLPQNGQAVTYSIIFLMSALTDIITVFVMLLVSALLIVISFVCVKYSILAALEDEIGEIGTMKAIGLPFADIREIYLKKYRLLALTGAALGYCLAFWLSRIFLKHISTTFGYSRISAFAVILSLIAAVMVFLLIHRHCKRILKKIRRLTVVDALVTGKGFSGDTHTVRDGLHKSRKLDMNWVLGLREVFYRSKDWMIIFTVVLTAVMMTMIPMNLLHTFRAPEFITYMGSPLEDILIEVETGEKLESGYDNVTTVLGQDSSIEYYTECRTVRVKTINSDQMPMNLEIDCGEKAGEGLQYLSGKAPQGGREIAISYLNSGETGKKSGDTILLMFGGKELEFIISGIYQDVTSGGFTAKSQFTFPELAANKYSFSVNLGKRVNASHKAEQWAAVLGEGVTVDPMAEFIDQTLGGVADQLQNIVLAASLVSACLAMLITVLFLKLHLARHSSENAIMKAVGFSEKDIKKQYLIKTGCVSFLGILAGIVMTELLGERIMNFGLQAAGIGIKSVHLMTAQLIEFLICPIILLGLILAVTVIMTGVAGKYSIMTVINE